MRRTNTFKISWIIVITAVIVMRFGFASAHVSVTDTTYLRYHKVKGKQSYLKNGLTFALPPLKPGVVSNVKISVPRSDDKLLQDVDVFPNPANDQLNFKFTLSHNSNVTIKIMDVLGNAVLNVVQERFETGEQKYTISIANKLNRGFYFARINAGTESVIKRISIY
ncbi:MAG: T9SS type A sorting domain-containing protein [Mucilaginibacter sp.]